ncbi:MAG: DUF4340 domain-containing protein [Caldithrix sp.]|nr:DUF4340 domain-containing protein [Caldithrix sp.]
MRNTLILLVIALALGAYVYFYEIKGGQKREKQKEYAAKLVHFEKDSVEQIQIKSPFEKFVFHRSANGWDIAEPVQTGADDSPINTLLTSLKNAKKERSFSIGPSEKDQYGVGNRATRIVLSLMNGQKDSLILGNNSNIGSNVYAAKVDTQVHLTAATVKTNANKSLFDWRDKKAIHFDKSNVREFTLKNRHGRFTFKKDGNQWKITEPIETDGEKSKIDAVLNKLDFGRIKSVVAEKAGRLSEYDLYRPAYEIELFLGPEKAKKRVMFSKLEENQAFGKDGVRPHIFTVDSNFIKPLAPNLFNFRDKQVVTFDKNQVDRLNLLYDGQLYRLSKDTSDTWKDDSGRKAKTFNVNSVLNAFKNLEAERFVKENPRYLMPYGLVNPEGKVEVFAGDDKLAELDIGYQKGDIVYIRNPRKDAVMAIKPDKLDQLFPEQDEIIQPVKKEAEETDSE